MCKTNDYKSYMRTDDITKIIDEANHKLKEYGLSVERIKVKDAIVACGKIAVLPNDKIITLDTFNKINVI